jgi:DNA-binding transcriptional MocR family regulator
MARLRRAGVAVTPGSLYFTGPAPDLCFRLSIANLKEPEIEAGCRRLGRVLETVVRG